MIIIIDRRLTKMYAIGNLKQRESSEKWPFIGID